MKPRVFINIATSNIGGPGKGLIQFIRNGGAELCDPLMTGFSIKGKPEGEFTQALQTLGVPFALLEQRMAFDPLLITQARNLVKAHDCQILQSHGYKPHALCCVLKYMTGLPWVAFVHGWTTEDLKVKLYHSLDQVLLGFADKIVVVADEIRQRLNTTWIDHRKIVTIPNAISPNDYSIENPEENVRQRYAIPEGIKLVGVVGRLSPEKGQIHFIEALPAVIASNPDVVAMLVGDGPDRESLSARVKELGLQDRVIFTGYQKKVAPFHRVFDLVVLPSLSEGMPNVALEAMLFGKPVIATRVGGVPEVVVDHVTGRVVSSGNAASLSEAMTALLSNMQLASQYGQAGKERVTAEFDPLTRAERIVQVYRELLGAAK